MRKRMFWLGLFLAGGLHAASVGPLGTNQRTLVICVRYTDAPTTRMAKCSDWVALLNGETNPFYGRATFNQTSFQFETISGAGAPANGWLDLAYGSAGYGFYRTGQDAITLADPFADFSSYNRVLVITSWPGFGGQGGGPWWWAVNEGAEATVTPAAGGSPVPSRLMTLANTNEWAPHSFGNPFDEGASVMAHELGHQLGAPTHYGGINVGTGGRDTVSPWDIMGFSPSLNHFLGYPKVQRGWIPAGPRIVDVGPPTTTPLDQTVTLRPLEQATGSAQVIRIPFTSSAPFIGYLVENRRRINGDERLPAQGVLITAVDESPNSILPAYVVENPSAPLDLNQAPLDVGGVFTDPARNLTVTVLSQSGDDYDVRVQYAPRTNTLDPAITPWGSPPWETADIWIDSQRNLYDTYLYTDGGGQPIGNGDDAWVNHDNRVYVRVRNYGTGVATQVRAQVFVNSPPGMGDAGPGWDYIGTVLLPSIAPMGEARGFVTWRPGVGAHTCIKVILADTPGELLTSNNVAQENVTHFDSSPGSPYGAVHLDTTVYNPFDQEMPVRIHVRDVPYGWAVVTDPPQMNLPARGRHPVHVAVYPSGQPAHDETGRPVEGGGEQGKECREPVRWNPSLIRKTSAIGFLGQPKVEAQVPFLDTFLPIGGIEIWTQLTRRTELTCRVAGERESPARARFPFGPHTGLPPDRQPEGNPPVSVPTPGRNGPRIDPSRIYEQSPLVLRPEPEPRVRPGRVKIEGRITPALEGALIVVEVEQNGKARLYSAKTDGEGRYTVTTGNLRERGRVEVRSFFDGDRENSRVESGFCSFEVSSRKR